MNSLLSNFSDARAPPQQQSDYGGRIGDPSPSNHTDQIPLSQMSPSDRNGIAGFLATIHSEDPVVRGLAKGIDLTTLGLNLNSPE